MGLSEAVPFLALTLVGGWAADRMDRRWLALADRSVTIKMHHGTDSLNIAMAGAIFLYHYTRPQK